MRPEGGKSRTNSGWGVEHLPTLAELRSSPEEACAVTLAASTREKGDLRVKGQQPGPACLF